MKYGENAVAFKKMILALVACLLIIGQVLEGDAAPHANGSSLVGNAFAAEQPSSDEQSGKSDTSLIYSYEQIGLSALALALLGLIFWWVIIFFSRNEQSSYLGRRYQASIF